MKILLLILALGATTPTFGQLPAVSAEVYRHVPLRLFGTNLYDFAPIIQDVVNGKPTAQNYFVTGIVTQIKIEGLPSPVVIERSVGKPYFAFVGGSINAGSDTGDLLTALAASSIAEKNGGKVSLGQYMSMSPRMRENYQLIQDSESVIVSNCPEEYRREGLNVAMVAMPMGKYNPQNQSLDVKGLPYYNFGKKFDGKISDFKIFFRITSKGIVSVKLDAEDTGSISNRPPVLDKP